MLGAREPNADMVTQLESDARLCSRLSAQASVLHEMSASLRHAARHKPIGANDVIGRCDSLRSRLQEPVRDLIGRYLGPVPGGNADGASGEWLDVDSNWLTAWLLHEVSSDEVLDNLLPPADLNPSQEGLPYGPQSILRLVESVCTCARFVIYQFLVPRLRQRAQSQEVRGLPISTEPPSRRTDLAKLRLVTELAHARGVPRHIPLFDHLEGMYATELVAYAIHQHGAWRQDLFHAQDVCLLGAALLRARVRSESRATVDLVGARQKGSAANLEANWFVASLLHDIGIGPRVAKTLLSDLGGAQGQTVEGLLKPAAAAIDAAAEELPKLDEYVCSAPDDQPPAATDHGLISTQRVRALIEEMLPGTRADLTKQFTPALEAIAQHNLKRPVDGQANPIAALLIICDLLQDWDRPRLDRDALAHVVLNMLRQSGSKMPDTGPLSSLTPDPSLSIDVHEVSDGQLVLPCKGLCTIIYGAEYVQGVFQPVVGWVDATQRLQSMELPTGFPAVALTFEHSCRPDKHSLALGRLADFANERQREYGHLLSWIEALRADEQPRCRYCSRAPTSNQGPATEEFTISLAAGGSLRKAAPRLGEPWWRAPRESGRGAADEAGDTLVVKASSDLYEDVTAWEQAAK